MAANKPTCCVIKARFWLFTILFLDLIHIFSLIYFLIIITALIHIFIMVSSSLFRKNNVARHQNQLTPKFPYTLTDFSGRLALIEKNEWWMVHLLSRLLGPVATKRPVLGRRFLKRPSFNPVENYNDEEENYEWNLSIMKHILFVNW